MTLKRTKFYICHALTKCLGCDINFWGSNSTYAANCRVSETLSCIMVRLCPRGISCFLFWSRLRTRDPQKNQEGPTSLILGDPVFLGKTNLVHPIFLFSIFTNTTYLDNKNSKVNELDSDIGFY